MGVNLIFRIAAVGILVSVICQVLKHSGRDEQAFLTSLAGLVLVLFWMIPYIYDLFETMKNLFAHVKRAFSGRKPYDNYYHCGCGDCHGPAGGAVKD